MGCLPRVLLLHLAECLDQLQHAPVQHGQQLAAPHSTATAATTGLLWRPCCLQCAHCCQQLRSCQVDSWHCLQGFGI